MAKLTHLDPEGRPVMVDVSAKAVTRRLAVAAGYLELDVPAAEALAGGGGPKGDPWSVARIGAVGGVKRTSDLIPLAHPLVIEAVDVTHHWDPATRRAWLKVQVRCEGRTGIGFVQFANHPPPCVAQLHDAGDYFFAVSHEWCNFCADILGFFGAGCSLQRSLTR